MPKPVPSDTFRVVATESGDWWAIRVEELDWVFSQASHLSEVADTARDAIAAYYDVQPSDIGDIIVHEVVAMPQTSTTTTVDPRRLRKAVN